MIHCGDKCDFGLVANDVASVEIERRILMVDARRDTLDKDKLSAQEFNCCKLVVAKVKRERHHYIVLR